MLRRWARGRHQTAHTGFAECESRPSTGEFQQMQVQDAHRFRACMRFVSQGREQQRPACDHAVFEVHREIPDQVQPGARKIGVWWGALPAIAVIFSAACAFAQQGASSQAAPSSEPTQSTQSRANPETPASQQQPQRILGIMPNFRAVSPERLRRLPRPKKGLRSPPRTASTTPLLSSSVSPHW